MPFTFAHPSIVLLLNWFNKGYLSVLGLFMGSISPDMAYFFLPYNDTWISHDWTLEGILLFNLPVCIVSSLVFYYLIKKSLILNLPHSLSMKYVGYVQNKSGLNKVLQIAIFTISSLIGILSHILWDASSKMHGFVTIEIPQLRNNLFNQPLWAWNYRVGSIIGLVIVIIFIYRMRQDSGPLGNGRLSKDKLWYWSIMISMTIVYFLFRYTVRDATIVFDIWHIVVNLIGGLIVGLVLSSLIDRMRFPRAVQF